MTNEQANGPAVDFDDVTPDSLMERFHGRGMMSIAIFSLIVHAAVLLGSSVPFIVKEFLGSSTADMKEDERLDIAVREATASLKAIAEEHGLNPQDLSNRFSRGSKRTVAPPVDIEPAETDENTKAGADAPAREKSEYEKNLEQKAEGPALPAVGDEEEDLFK